MFTMSCSPVAPLRSPMEPGKSIGAVQTPSCVWAKRMSPNWSRYAWITADRQNELQVRASRPVSQSLLGSYAADSAALTGRGPWRGRKPHLAHPAPARQQADGRVFFGPKPPCAVAATLPSSALHSKNSMPDLYRSRRHSCAGQQLLLGQLGQGFLADEWPGMAPPSWVPLLRCRWLVRGVVWLEQLRHQARAGRFRTEVFRRPSTQSGASGV